MVAGILAAAAFGLYLLTRGHVDAPSVPDAATQATAQPPFSNQTVQPTPSSANAFGGQAPALGSASDTAMSADPLAAAMQRLRAAQAQGQGAPKQPGQPPALAPLSSLSAGTPARAPDVGSTPQATPSDGPTTASTPSTPPQRSVAAGRHTTASGVRWSLATADSSPSLVVDIGNGKEAVIRVGPEFMKLDIHAMSRNVEHVSALISRSYMGEPGNYLFTPDGRLFRTE